MFVLEHAVLLQVPVLSLDLLRLTLRWSQLLNQLLLQALKTEVLLPVQLLHV